MSKVAIQGNADGTGTFTIAAPNSDTDRTLTLPNEAGTVLTSASGIDKSQFPSGSIINVSTDLVGGQVSYTNSGVLSFIKEFSYTPLYSDSSLFCMVHMNGISNGGSGRLELRLNIDTSSGSGSSGTQIANGQVALDGAGTNHLGASSLSAVTSLGDTNTRYIKVFAYKNDTSTTWYVNQYDGSPICFTVMEIAG